MNWGGSLKPRGDDMHCTLWRTDEGKGERLSWDQGSAIRNLHHTDQNTGQHSTDPSRWRTGEELLGTGCALLFLFGAGLLALIVVGLVVVA